jgi:hypothetical protein
MLVKFFVLSERNPLLIRTTADATRAIALANIVGIQALLMNTYKFSRMLPF